MEGDQGAMSYNIYGTGNGRRNRVMVVVDHSSTSRHAMLWALSHVADNSDFLTFLHVIPPDSSESSSTYLSNSLSSLCNSLKPQVEVEVVVIEGPKLGTVMNQVKKLEVSVLVVGQKEPPSLLFSCLCGGGTTESDEFVEDCINNAECWSIGVRKQSRGMGGYLISTRFQKNFWLLA